MRLIPLFILLLIVACSGNDNEKEAQLQGRWDCVYVERANEVLEHRGIRFEFEGGDYQYYTGGQLWEEGKFWVAGRKLYTEGPEVMKKSVEIEKLANDSLVLGMNDRGRDMTMVFVRSGQID